MGGLAFSSGEKPLFTPRMPRPVYDAVKQRCTAVLGELYHYVGTPIEGPDKNDFGDVDMVVARPRDESSSSASIHDALDVIVAALGATRAIVFERAPSSLALPWPAAAMPVNTDDTHGETERYVQVDVRICASPEALRWLLFKHAHGDIWNILGSLIRAYGLTVDEDALWLRVAEIEAVDRNRAKVLLSKDPDRVLDFLGLPPARFWEGQFACADDMYEYVALCRMFWVPRRCADDDAVAGGGADVGKLKSNDRRRLKQRPTFRRWVDDFVPRCRAAGRFSAPQTTRDAITSEALSRFDAEPAFTARRDAFLQERQALVIRDYVIKPAAAAAPVPGPPPAASADAVAATYRACLSKALRAIVLDDDGTYGVVPGETLRGADGLFVVERVEAFVARCRDEVGAVAMERHRQKYEAHRLARNNKAGGVK